MEVQPTLLKPEEAAMLLNISRSQMFALMARGEIPGVVRIRRSVRISRIVLERWIAEQASNPAPGRAQVVEEVDAV